MESQKYLKSRENIFYFENREAPAKIGRVAMSGLFSPEYLIPLNMRKLSNHPHMRNIVMVSLAEASLSEENPANSLPVNDVIIIPNA